MKDNKYFFTKKQEICYRKIIAEKIKALEKNSQNGTVDQEYNKTSENAQSGIAVEQALNNFVPEKIMDLNSKNYLSFWTGTQEEYDAIEVENRLDNILYVIK